MSFGREPNRYHGRALDSGPMPRALSLAIQRHVLPWREMDWPLPFERIFGRSAPLALEIGFGSGEFLVEQAAAHPERDHVGIELSWTSATHLFRRIDHASLANVKVLLADAELAVGLLLGPESVAEVFVNHPCPWPKARHTRRRLMSPEFVALLADRMVLDARMRLVTDHADYATWFGEVLESQNALASCHETTEIGELPGHSPTRYQRKALAQGLSIHFFEWRKVRSPACIPPLLTTDPLETMPNLTLQSRDARAGERTDLFDGFEPTTHHEMHCEIETVVRLVSAYRGLDGRTWLVDALVVEDKLHQEFGIQVVLHPDGNLLIKLSPLGRPHPTHGVKTAVWRVGRWLLDRHDDLEVKHQTVGREVLGAAMDDALETP